MSTPADHLDFQKREFNKLTSQLNMMRKWGVSELDPGFQKLYRAQTAAMQKIGRNLPRTTTLVKYLVGLSPGEIKLWADAEIGWVVESTAAPGAPVVRKLVPDQVAELLLTGKMTHELEEVLMAPDTYEGE